MTCRKSAKKRSSTISILLDVILFAVSAAVLAQHILATRNHFVSKEMATGAALLAVLVIGTAVIFALMTFLSPHPVLAVVIGVLIEGASLLVFRGAIRASKEAALLFAFDPGNPSSLLQTGPTGVRHPFYTSYLMFWIGWAVAIYSLWALPPLVALMAFYVAAARGEERKFASTELENAYAQYRRRAGLFWPKLGGNSAQ